MQTLYQGQTRVLYPYRSYTLLGFIAAAIQRPPANQFDHVENQVICGSELSDMT